MMMALSTSFSLFFFILFPLLCTFIPPSLADDFTTVEQRLFSSHLPPTPSSLLSVYNAAKSWSEELQEGGFWKDISKLSLFSLLSLLLFLLLFRLPLAFK
jgi:hypothetical protein